jgi:4-hydroxyphenylpyruvate dioxygenase
MSSRQTLFLEIIQRIGCMEKDEQGREYQKGGCGGFGKGNFSQLFKSIEDYEKSLESKQAAVVQGS